jgi:hypothetical protein
MRGRLGRHFIAVIPLLLLTVTAFHPGCAPERKRINTAEPSSDFDLGPVTEYDVSSAVEVSVEDSVAGGTFVFPSGAEGSLGVARILTAPIAFPDGADGFRVEFTSDDRIHLELPREENTEPQLWVYAIPATSTFETLPQPETWLPLMPADTLSNPAVFELYEPGEMPEPGAAKERPPQSYYFMRRYITRDGWEWQNMSNIRTVTRWTIADVLDSLPADLQPFGRQETAERLALRAWIAIEAPQANAYAGFQWWALGLYRRVYPHFSFVATGSTRATESTIAHEVGHYFTHVFLGDDGFAGISEQLRDEHEFGDPHPERPMLEEYALYIDFMKNGSLGGSVNPEQPFSSIWLDHEDARPANVDWPSQEGYPTCLLARLRAASGTLIGQSGGAEEIPTVGMSHAGVLGILFRERPTTANHLRASIAAALQARGQADRLSPLLERTGWSYHGRGIVQDAAGRPLAGAWVRSVYRVASEGGRAYYAPIAPVETRADGTFEISRLFPGRTSLQVQVGDAVHEFPLEVDANRPTTDDLNLGTLKVEDSLLNRLRALTWMRIRCEGQFMLDNGAWEVKLFGDAYGSDHEVAWTGNSLVWDYADSSGYDETMYGERMHCEATFSADGRTVLNLVCHQDEWQTFQGRLQHTRTSDVDIVDLPLTWAQLDSPLSNFAYFGLTGEAIGPHVRSIAFVERYLDIHDITNTAIEFRWTGTQLPGYFELGLRDDP